MTGEVAPLGHGNDAAPSDELRASHEDRDRVAELLRTAAGDGRLTAEELDERLEKALTARTYGELMALSRDLPAAPGFPASGRPRSRRASSASTAGAAVRNVTAAGSCRNGLRSGSRAATSNSISPRR